MGTQWSHLFLIIKSLVSKNHVYKTVVHLTSVIQDLKLRIDVLKKWAAFRKFWLIIIHRARLDSRSIKYCYDGETGSHIIVLCPVPCSLFLTDMFTVCLPAWCCAPAPACRPASACSWTRPPPVWEWAARCTSPRTWSQITISSRKYFLCNWLQMSIFPWILQ